MKTTLRETLAAPTLNAEAKLPKGGQASWLAVILGGLGAVLYSMKAIFVKLAYQPMDWVGDGVGDGAAENAVPVITLMLLRMGFAFPVYFVILILALSRSERKPTIRQVVLAALAGLMSYYMCTLLDFTGLRYITAQLERLLLFTYPAFVIIFGVLFFGGQISRAGGFAVALAYAGLVVVFTGGEITVSDHLWLGSALILATAILFALFQLLAKGFIDHMGAQLFTCIAMIGALAAILAHFFIYAASVEGGVRVALDLSPRIWMLGAVIAVFSTILPSFFTNYAIGKIGAQKVAMLGMLGPLATIVAAIVVLGEPFGIWDFVGTAITIAGIALYMRVSRASTKASA